MRNYLYIEQLAQVTPWSPSAIRTMMTRGIFKLGVHYFKPQGPNGRPIFSWPAVVHYIEGKSSKDEPSDIVRLTDGSVFNFDEATKETARLLR